MKRRQTFNRQIRVLALSLLLMIAMVGPLRAEDLQEVEIYRNLEVTDSELWNIAERLLSGATVGIDLETFGDESRVEQLAKLYRGLYFDSVIFRDMNLHYFNQLANSKAGLTDEQIEQLEEHLLFFIDAEYVLELALKNDLLDDLWGPSFDTIDAAADEQAEIRDEAIALRAWVRVRLDHLWDESPEKQRGLLGEIMISLQDPMADLMMNLRPDDVGDVVELELDAVREMQDHFREAQDLATWVTWLDDGALGSLPENLLQNMRAIRGRSIARDEKVYGAFDRLGNTLYAAVSGEDVQELMYAMSNDDKADAFLQTVFKEDLSLEHPEIETNVFREDIYHIKGEDSQLVVIVTKVSTGLQSIYRVELAQ